MVPGEEYLTAPSFQLLFSSQIESHSINYKVAVWMEKEEGVGIRPKTFPLLLSL